MRLLQICVFVMVMVVSKSQADSDDDKKIEYLLKTVETSDCVFIRNGKEHTSTDAGKHLRMKYRRGKKWATDTESFISRIATKSSFSGKPYRIRCEEQGAQLTAGWLRERLSDFPSTAQSQSGQPH